VDSERELEVIRDEMEQTRANLADKLGALESQVRETVTSASETVTSTVEGVKEVVSNVTETVGTVTDTLNIPKQIEQHPWAAMGVAMAAGFVAAQLLGDFGGVARGAPQGPQPDEKPEPRHDGPPAYGAPQPQPRHEEHAKASGPSLMSQAASMLPSLESLVPDFVGKASAALPSFDKLAPELKTLSDTIVNGLGALAVGGVMNIVRELAADALPDSWRGEITKIVDDVTQQLGGKPLPAKQDQQGQQQPSSSQQKPAEGQNIQQKPNEQPQGNPRGRREGRSQLVGQG